ncbi:MAG: FecR domain-containing protein [Archangiaceae bacterium]|nr:FecR domain-containing protein [Archangiaceae bacterium]
MAEAPLPVAVDRRLKARLFGKAPAPAVKLRWKRARLVAVAASVVLTAGAALWLVTAGPRTTGGFETVAASGGFAPALGAGGTVEVAGGSGVLRVPEEGVSLALSSPASLRRDPDGVRVLRGEVDVAVRKRPRAAGPVRVHVSGGTIEVFGTRFTLVERGDSGEVRLFEGSVGFRSEGRALEMLEPGQTLQWPRPPPREPEPQPDPSAEPEPLRKRDVPAHAPLEETDALLREVASLRTRGRYTEAVALLDERLARKLRPASREVLSYELGAILTWQLRDSAAACAHWSQHQRAHPRGRFAKEIANARRALGCR